MVSTKIAVEFGGEPLDLNLDPGDDRLLGFWPGATHEPEADPADFARRFAAAIAEPSEFPPLSLALVPGDRVAVALDLPAAAATAAVAELARVCGEVGVEEFTVVAAAPAPADLPPGVTWEVHDPDDRAKIAYLATTQDGQRVYLNRAITDADLVLPIGMLGFDRTLGYSGPWSAVYPGLSDRETQARFRGLAGDLPASPDEAPPALAEASEVGWLIGCQLQVGVLPVGPGRPGPVLAGLESLVRERGIAALDRDWTFEVAERADVVVAGVGGPGRFASVADLGAGLAAATRLVRRGGKIVALARIDGTIGPAVRRLAGVENPKAALNRLRGHEAEPDYVAAKQIATALAWADIYLASGLDADTVEDLAIIPLGRPEEARKLASSAASLIVLNAAERTRCFVRDEA